MCSDLYIHIYSFALLSMYLTHGMCIYEVHPFNPGELVMYQLSDEPDSVHTVSPQWGYARNKKANLVWEHHLMIDNKQHLHRKLTSSITNLISQNDSEKPAQPQLLPYRVIQVAGDGRCGWRAILCGQDPESFLLVPRTWAETQIFEIVEHCTHRMPVDNIRCVYIYIYYTYTSAPKHGIGSLPCIRVSIIYIYT